MIDACQTSTLIETNPTNTSIRKVIRMYKVLAEAYDTSYEQFKFGHMQLAPRSDS